MKFFCLLALVAHVSGNQIRSQSGDNTVVTSTVASVHVQASTTQLPNTTNHNEPWYGQEEDTEDVVGCRWPLDFENRLNFCANRSSIAEPFSLGDLGGAEFGILDKEIGSILVEKCADGDCSDARINRSDLLTRAELWWNHTDHISDFSKCLKKNSEGMVRLCGSDTKIGQTISGIAGLHLNIMDALAQARDHIKKGENQTELCLTKLSESLHFTAAVYLTLRYYTKNSVLCWDVTKGSCTPTCKQFAYTLACLESVCSDLTADFLKGIGVWQWFYMDVAQAKKTCGVDMESAQCHLDSMAFIAGTPTQSPSGFISKSKALVDQFKAKYNEFQHTVEGYTHMPFFQIALIFGGGLAVFIGSIVIMCLWYHGFLCQRRKKRVLRYTRLTPDDQLGQKSDESKSLTRDFDEIE